MRSALLNLSLTGSPAPQPVLPGDHPDPTILRVGQHFWASATSAEWSPQFPLFHSTDLIHWSPAGWIFPVQPAWAEGSFWAPELVEDRGRFFVYYVGRARGGPLSIAVATAPSPAGPWTDHGPILAEPLGSIDPSFARDEHGEPFLIWKTDGNSKGQPTPIRAQPLSPDLLHLTGQPTELIRDDQPWEGGIVEGPYILRHAGRFFLFYAGNSCCGRECKYAEGVARADHLLGPWTKSPANPILNANDLWRCPGHGTAVRGTTMHGKKGQDYLLYHAYPEPGAVFVGREAVLDQITWTADGWPAINAGQGPGGSRATQPVDFLDDFRSPDLNASWQWPVNTHPTRATGVDATGEGRLLLRIPLDRQSAMLAVPIPGSPLYIATVVLQLSPPPDDSVPDPVQPGTPTYNPPPATSWTGLSVIGDPFNTVGIGIRGNALELWRRRGAEQFILWSSPLPAATTGQLWLRAQSTVQPTVQSTDQSTAQSTDTAQILLSFSLDGIAWTPSGSPVDASDLPAWDRGLRVALMLEGPARTSAAFAHFSLTS